MHLYTYSTKVLDYSFSDEDPAGFLTPFELLCA